MKYFAERAYTIVSNNVLEGMWAMHRERNGSMKAVILYLGNSRDLHKEHYFISEFNHKENDVYIICDENNCIKYQQRNVHIITGCFVNRIQAYKCACNHLQEHEQIYEAIVFCDNSFFGPFETVESMQRQMEEKGVTSWSVSRYFDRFDENYNEKKGHVDTSFLYLQGEKKDRVIKFLREVNSDEIEILEEAEIFLDKVLPKLDTYIDFTELESQQKLNNIEWLEALPCYMVKEYGSPIIKKESLKRNDYRFTDAKEIWNAIEYVKENTEYDVNTIWDYLLTNFDITYLIDMLQLRYVISDVVDENEECNLENCAIIMHITYEMIIEKVFRYISNIPEEIDIYITTKGDKCIEKVKEQVIRIGRKNCKVLIANEKGRDVSALLITCKSVLEQYEYICFVHDQKTRNGLGPAIIGENNMWDRWDNTVKNDKYIKNLVAILKREERLGIIMPPVLQYSGLFTVYATSWGANYYNTKVLAKRLNIEVPIGNYTYSNGTTFWCKTEAMKKLFDGGITLDDFPPEPTPADGTIMHVIEKIFPYVAQDAGYYTAIAECTEYAARHVGNLDCMLRGLINKIEYPTGGYYFNFVEHFNLEKLDAFIKKYKKVYIYGNGKVARELGKVLDKRKWSYEAYVVSDDRYIGTTEGRVIRYSEISQNRQDTGIIVGLAGYNQREVVPQLIKDGYKNIFIV